MPEHAFAPAGAPANDRATMTVAPRPTVDTALDVALLRDAGDACAPMADLPRSPGFFRLHAAHFSRAWYATAMDASTGSPLAGAWFAETAPGAVTSGARGPYGGFHTPFSPLPIPLAARLVTATEEELRARDVRSLCITLPPAAHEEEAHAEWMNVFLRLGYRVAPPDLNYHVWVSDIPLTARMHGARRATVQTAGRKGVFARALRPSERADAYTVLVQHHLRLGRPLTMTFEALLAMESALPGALHWFGVYRGDEMVAASVGMRLSPDVLHICALGEVDGMERSDPGTLLVSHVHDWCRDHRIALLDLGVASADGVPHEATVARNRYLGFDVSPRYTVEKELAA